MDRIIRLETTKPAARKEDEIWSSLEACAEQR